jgi:hypothetical protein
MSLPTSIPMSALGGDGSLYGHPMGYPMGHPMGHPMSYSMGGHQVAHMGLPPPGALHRTDSTSEFNAAAFDGMLAASLRAGPGAGPGAGVDAVDGPASTPSARFTRLGKAQSLGDLSRAGSRLGDSRLGDYWRLETAPSRPVSVAYMMPTQSLDRRLHRPRRAVSMADLGALGAAYAQQGFLQPMYYRDAYGRDFICPAPPLVQQGGQRGGHPGMLYRGATSKTSLGAASDDFRKYRDVAL